MSGVSVFSGQTAESSFPWKTLNDLDLGTALDWNSNSNNIRSYKHKQMPVRLSGSQLKGILLEQNKIIETVTRGLEDYIECSMKPYVFLWMNSDGIVMSVQGSPELVEQMDQDINLGIGTSFTIEHAGVNAISVAMKLGESVFIRGDEHDLPFFSEWSCLCGPIIVGDKIIGYLDMSFSANEDVALAGSIFEHCLRKLTKELSQGCPEARFEILCKKFQEFGLTSREMEIGYRWLMNHSVLRMAEELGITEGTVRLYLKKIYRKTGVGDKGQFFMKFLM